jgi:DNA repair exonuclease SbcCD nuclease subunit
MKEEKTELFDKAIQRRTEKKHDKWFFTDFFMLADLHIGIKLGAEEWISNMRDYFEQWFFPLIREKKTENSVVLVLGDLYDDRKAINLEANDLCIDIIEKMASILPVIIINGNHDMYKKSDNKITSLRSLENIPNTWIIKKPTVLSLKETTEVPSGPDETTKKDKKFCDLAFIPYQGDTEKETDLCNACNKADYVFMHTDIKHLRYDNGRDIIKGVEIGDIRGHIYSGHIHKRQDSEKVTYVGSPYQLRRSDIGNQKGIYHVDIKSKKVRFYENHFSPIFQKIWLKDILDSPFGEVLKTCENNYTDILVDGSESEKFNVSFIYDAIKESKPKRVQIKEVNKDGSIVGDEDDDGEYKEMTASEIIDSLIDKMEMPQEKKDHLKALSARYQELASADDPEE